MKKIGTLLKSSLLLLVLLIVPGFQLIAAETATADSLLPSSAYTLQLTDRTVNLYYGPFPIVLFSLMLATFIYLIYRYWSNGTLRDDMSHTPHHQ